MCIYYTAYGLKIAAISSKKFSPPAGGAGGGFEGTLKNNYLYQGAYSEMDDDIGWNDFALRNYDAQIGRWVQQDPYQEFASPYVGMGNDPVNNVDPSGGNAFSGLTVAGKLLVTTLGGAIIGAAADALSGGDGWTGAAVGAGIGLAGGLINNISITSMIVKGAGVATTAINTSLISKQVGYAIQGNQESLGKESLGHGPNPGNFELGEVNNPDPTGPGDRFKTAEEAARDWGKKYNDNSIVDGKEYGSTIYKFKENGKTYYSYSIPNRATGSGARIQPSKAPTGTTPVADIHSHGNAWGEGVEYSDNNFSTKDKRVINNKKIDGYLTTPNGSLKKYNYTTGKETLINTDMPSDPKYPKLRKNNIDPFKLPKNEPSVPFIE